MAYRPDRPGAHGFGKIYKSREHYDLARNAKRDYSRGGISVTIDTKQIEKLRQALLDAGASIKKGDAVLAQSLNRAGNRVRTDIKIALQRWTGIRRQKELVERMRPVRASPADMKAGVIVSGRHLRITRVDFGASWRRTWSGGRHSAWARPQTAEGSFMAFRKRGGKYGGGLLMTRVAASRKPIKPLWGPHPVREMQRHEAYCRAIITKNTRWFMAEATRRTEAQFIRVKGKYGL